MPSDNLIARGYHGTTAEAATDIVTRRKFKQEVKPWHWLGQGVYFWQDAPVRAWDWAEQVVGEELRKGKSATPAVVSATIDLSNCLDLLDIKQWNYLEQAWEVIRHGHQQAFDLSGTAIPTQVGPAEVFSGESTRRYGNNICDYEAMNLAIQLLRDDGAATSTARGAFMEGSDLFKGSWLWNRSHVQIAIVDPDQILNVISDLQIEDGLLLKSKHDELVKAQASSWSRQMKPVIV